MSKPRSFKKVQKELAIQQRIELLLIDHRGFSKRQLYNKAKQFVECKNNGYQFGIRKVGQL